MAATSGHPAHRPVPFLPAALLPAALLPAVLLACAALLLSGCQKPPGTSAGSPAGGRKTIVVTYSVLGSVVRDLVGDAFDVVVAVPNGIDPHDWEPSARDIEVLNRAALVVENGLGLEGGMEKVLQRARAAGVRFFTASDHIQVRIVHAGEGVPAGDPDQEAGAKDPHLWTDPLAVKAVVAALAAQITADFGVDLSSRAADLEKRLDDLDAEARRVVEGVPTANRKLVTGHQSLGYFAQRYGFQLVGAIIPNLSTQAEASASQLAALVKRIKDNHVSVVFTELGTPPAIAQALARDAGAKAVELRTHSLAAGGTYFSFIRDLAGAISGNLRP
jgi:zinc/manganese transport system substrate-binding protein